MTEIALCLPILCVLLLATAQYGVMIWRDMELASATRDGARHAAVSRHDSDPVTSVRNVVLESVDDDQILDSQLTVTVSGGWAQDSVVNVTATTPYALDIFGLHVWSGNLRSRSTVRVG